MTSSVKPATEIFVKNLSLSRQRVVWTICALTLSLVLGAAVLQWINQTRLVEMFVLAAVVSSTAVGAMITTRRAANVIGQLLLASALCYSLYSFLVQYALYGAVTRPGSVPLVPLASWLVGLLVLPGVTISLVLLPLYYPTGHLPSPRWRPLLWVLLGFLLFSMAFNAIQPGNVQDFEGLVNPLGMMSLEPLVPTFMGIMLAGWIIFICAAAWSLVIRFRRATDVVQLQIKWLTYAVVAYAILLLLTVPTEKLIPELYWLLEVLFGLAFAGIPVTIGIAVLHYHLYDIDLLINRAVVYGVLTACVVSIYALLVGYLGELFRVDYHPLISIAATGVIAVMFQPLRARLQQGVNRWLYGERDDPYTVLARLGQRLEASLTPETALPTIVETVAHALHLPYVEIHLETQTVAGNIELPIVRASYGQLPSIGHPLVQLPITHQGHLLGTLLLALRPDERELRGRDRQLLDDLVRQASSALAAVRLTAELRHSRDSIIVTREEERRRLRRDLHDGLGPVLATLVVQSEAARDLIEEDPETAKSLLVDVTAQAQEAIVDVRRLVDGLRPPTLDDLGVVGALQAYAARHVFGETKIEIHAPERLPALPAAVEVALYRIAQEAMTNVIKHARARRCIVTLRIDEVETRSMLVLEVSDDGIGLSRQYRSGVGLTAMQERAIEVGGRCEILPASNGGSRVRACLPI